MILTDGHGLHFLPSIAHHSAHTSAALTTFVIGEADDRHRSPALSFQDQPDGVTEFREHRENALQIDHRDPSHVRPSDELAEISADGLQFCQHVLQPVNENDLL